MIRQSVSIALALVTLPLALAAQSDSVEAEPRGYFGFAGYYGRANGEFARNVKDGAGGGGQLIVSLQRGGNVGIRLSGMFLVYGSQTRRYSLLPGIDADVTTSNIIGGGMVGPQIQAGGRVLKAYAFGGIGFSYFATTSSVEGAGNSSPFASTTNYDDVTLAGEAGGGLLVRLGRSVHLDLGARYLNNGLVTYVTRSGVTVSGNTLVVTPVTSDADMVIYHLGLTIELRPDLMKQKR